jgi:hypothetical protein
LACQKTREHFICLATSTTIYSSFYERVEASIGQHRREKKSILDALLRIDPKEGQSRLADSE